MKPSRILLLLALASCIAYVQAAAADSTALYLSDAFKDLSVKTVQGWGVLGINTAAFAQAGREGAPLHIGEKTYAKGLGHHAPGELVFTVPPGCVAFDALAGVHWQGGGKGSVVFQVFVDGEKRFDSGKLRDSDAPKAIHIPLNGARQLRLVAGDSGDGIGCDMANWAEARFTRDPDALIVGKAGVALCGKPAPAPSSPVAGFSLIAEAAGSQAALLGEDGFAVCVRQNEDAEITVPVTNLKAGATISAEVAHVAGGAVDVEIAIEGRGGQTHKLRRGITSFEVKATADAKTANFHLRTRAPNKEATVIWRSMTLRLGDSTSSLLQGTAPSISDQFPPPVQPVMRPTMETAFIEWDWRMQDGIDTPREPVTYAAATERTLARGDTLIGDLQASEVALGKKAANWQALRAEADALRKAKAADKDPRWEDLWRRVHHARREIVFANPLADTGPLVFLKRVPAAFSHQLTQYYGRNARPGGGVFVLDAPGTSMACRELATGELPQGSYQHPEVSYDGKRILFAFCKVPDVPVRGRKMDYIDRYYKLYEMAADGSGLRQISDGPHDDFSPRELPSGQLMFLSTRRGGFHRCGAGPCRVYTLTIADGDGSNARTVSYHETQEWDPAVLNDGRVIYTRWDYVDRNAVHYQQLWTVRPDGSYPAAYYGNNTFSPVGVWEAQPIPGSRRVMATAAAHHAMTAGSIILLDVAKGVDGAAPITRLTPDALFPESETWVAPRNWHAPGSPAEIPKNADTERWPGHSYRNPYPLSEDYFLAAYSYTALIGEPDGNMPNMFGLYFVDRFGNKELLYRDLNIGSQWPTPLRARTRPPVIPETLNLAGKKEGSYFVQSVYESDPALPKELVKRLRIVQVLPKTTPNANQPRVGVANASPGKQVLGTVPVEADGSAFFKAPAGIPLAFQALDDQGRAVQVMRSVSYLQPGENASCVGCHEHRLTAPVRSSTALAMQRPPSAITPAPDGSNPLSYPILVQPVLDKHCVKCHGKEKPAGPKGKPVVLTGEPQGTYTASYNALANRVAYAAWGKGDLRKDNSEPLTRPGHFGSKNSQLINMLLAGHHDVKLSEEDMERLTTWIGANGLFYGTFNVADQARQQQGERIEGPELQ